MFQDQILIHITVTYLFVTVCQFSLCFFLSEPSLLAVFSLGLSYKQKDLLWSKAWNIKYVHNWQTTPLVDLPVTGNFRFLLFIVADQLADLLADLSPRSFSGSELQFQIFTVWAHIGRSSGKSTPPKLSIDPLNTTTSEVTDLPVHLNGNFTFLLSECCCKD